MALLTTAASPVPDHMASICACNQQWATLKCSTALCGGSDISILLCLLFAAPSHLLLHLGNPPDMTTLLLWPSQTYSGSGFTIVYLTGLLNQTHKHYADMSRETEADKRKILAQPTFALGLLAICCCLPPHPHAATKHRYK